MSNTLNLSRIFLGTGNYAFISPFAHCVQHTRIRHPIPLSAAVNCRNNINPLCSHVHRGMRFWVLFENVFTRTILLSNSQGAPREFRVSLNKAALISKKGLQNTLGSVNFSKQSLVAITFGDPMLWEKFRSLPDNDFQGRIAEVIHASKREYDYSSVLKAEEQSKLRVLSREPDELSSVLGKPSGTYGKLKLDGVDIETHSSTCQVSDISSELMKSALVHEIKTSTKGDLLGSLKSALDDKFFMMSKLELTKYLVSTYGLGEHTLDPTTLQKSFVYYGATPVKMKNIVEEMLEDAEETQNTKQALDSFVANYKQFIQKLVDSGVSAAEINVFSGSGITKSELVQIANES